MDLPAHTRERIAEIRDLHKPVRVWIRTKAWGFIPWSRAADACIICRQPYECRQIRWADDVEAGRVSPAGWNR